MTASTPYGRSAGSWMNVTPLALSSSKVLRQSSTRQAQPAHLALLELPADERGGLLVERRPGRHQGHLELRLARVLHGDPAEPLTHGDVGARLEAEHVDVEVAGLVLVEAVDGDERDVGDHASTLGRAGSPIVLLPDCARAGRPAVVEHAAHEQVAARARAAPPRAAHRLRYAVGLSPTSWVNRDENEPRLEKPTIMQISVTVRLAVRSRSWARSMRRRVR